MRKALQETKTKGSCDKAKSNGMALELLRFYDCNIRKKIIPLLPDGTYPDF